MVPHAGPVLGCCIQMSLVVHVSNKLCASIPADVVGQRLRHLSLVACSHSLTVVAMTTANDY